MAGQKCTDDLLFLTSAIFENLYCSQKSLHDVMFTTVLLFDNEIVLGMLPVLLKESILCEYKTQMGLFNLIVRSGPLLLTPPIASWAVFFTNDKTHFPLRHH